MQSKTLELDSILKRVCIQYFYAIIAVSSLFAAYYLYEGIKPLCYFVALCPIGHLLLIIIPYKLNYQDIRKLIPIYLVYISVFLYLNMLFFWHLGQITAFMWFSIIAVASMLFFDRKGVVLWCTYILILICSVFVVELFIPEGFLEGLTKQQLTVVNVMTILFSTGFIVFFIYYVIRVNLIKEDSVDEESDSCLTDLSEDKTTERLDGLYLDILSYFSDKKPYCDPDFSIVQLAKELNSNVKYISIIIKKKEDVNFRVFLNTYRINLVKELIQKDYHNKFTIKYIYITAGFRHQSTFNKVFKEIEGITPSEYIKSFKATS